MLCPVNYRSREDAVFIPRWIDIGCGARRYRCKHYFLTIVAGVARVRGMWCADVVCMMDYTCNARAMDAASLSTTKGLVPEHAETVCGHESVIQKCSKPEPAAVNRRQDSLGKTPWVT